MTRRTKLILGSIAALAVIAVVPLALQAADTDTAWYGRLLVMSSYTAPTCATSTGVGDICAASDIEANGALDVATTSTLTGAVTAGSTLGVTGLITATGGLKTSKPLFLTDRLRFCGNGSNGATAWYDGPVLESDTATDFSLGSAGCDGNDSGTEATADRPMDAYSTIKVIGMACVTQAGGAADTNTFQLRSAAADVTGVTCAVTNDGAAAKTCSVVLSASVAIVVGATLAVKNTQSGTDNMSAIDMGCDVYYTY